MAKLPAPVSITRQLIFQHYEKRNEQGPRQHLGASEIGKKCDKELWLSFRWAQFPSFEGRMYRLFETGQREEERFVSDLRNIGIEVSEGPRPGEQWSFSACGGHFGGSMDGCGINIPEAPKTWHVLEFKTHNAKSFADLCAKGVKESKYQHWIQMQVYMHLSGMERALYMAKNKDNDDIYTERIRYDKEAAKAAMERADKIISSLTPPDGISNNPGWYECKMCRFHGICHGNAVALPNCRTCSYVEAKPDGTWHCAWHEKTLDLNDQKNGCDHHLYLPMLLANIAELVQADGHSNVVTYRGKNGEIFRNGGDGYTSKQLWELSTSE